MDSALAFHLVGWLFSQARVWKSELEIFVTTSKTKLRGLSPHANYTDRPAAARRRS